MEIKAEELLYRLQEKKDIPALGRVWAVFGEEDYYRQQITAATLNAIFLDTPEDDRQIYIYDRDTNLKALYSVVNTNSIFSDKTLVILHDEKLLAAKAESESKKQQLDELATILNEDRKSVV